MAKTIHSPILLYLLLLISSSPGCLVSSSSSSAYNEGINYGHRPDPLRGFRPYDGGYDIRSQHYWASAAFTGVHGVAMAGIWILGGLVFLGFYPVWKKRLGMSSSISSTIYSWSTSSSLLMMMIIVFVLFAIVASIITLVASHSFHGTVKRVERTLLGAAGASSHGIRRVLNAMREVIKVLKPYEPSIESLLSSITMELRNALILVRRVTHKDARIFDIGFGISIGVTVGIVSLNLLLVIAALLMLMCHWHPAGLITVIVICWILTSICWVLTGFHFFLHNFIEDTCSTVKEYVQNPANSSLNALLPCPSPPSAESLMAGVGLGIHSFMTQLNLDITMLSKDIESKEQSVQHVDLRVCDPFGTPKYNYNPWKCSNVVKAINGMTNVLERSQAWMSKGSQSKMSAYISCIKPLNGVLSDIKKLIHCSFVRDAITHVSLHQCKPLKASIWLLWCSLFGLSVSMMALEVALVIMAFQGRRGPHLSWKLMLCGRV